MIRKPSPNVNKTASEPFPHLTCNQYAIRKVTPSHAMKNGLYHHARDKCSLTSTMISSISTKASRISSRLSSKPRRTVVHKSDPSSTHANLIWSLTVDAAYVTEFGADTQRRFATCEGWLA